MNCCKDIVIATVGLQFCRVPLHLTTGNAQANKSLIRELQKVLSTGGKYGEC